MKKKPAYYLLIMVLMTMGITLSGCHKHEDDPSAPGPSINVTSPSDNSTFNSGDTIRLRGTLTDADELHEYEIKLVQKSDHKNAHDSVYYQFSEHKHAKSINIDRDIVVTVADHSDFELEISVSNHNGKTAQKTLHLHFMP